MRAASVALADRRRLQICRHHAQYYSADTARSPSTLEHRLAPLSRGIVRHRCSPGGNDGVAPGEESEMIVSSDLPYNFRGFSLPQMVLGGRRQVGRIGVPPLPWGFQAAVFWVRFSTIFCSIGAKDFFCPGRNRLCSPFTIRKSCVK
jgi:hypothetical protein